MDLKLGGLVNEVKIGCPPKFQVHRMSTRSPATFDVPSHRAVKVSEGLVRWVGNVGRDGIYRYVAYLMVTGARWVGRRGAGRECTPTGEVG